MEHGESPSAADYLRELGQQLRAELTQFYTVNAAFLVATSFITKDLKADSPFQTAFLAFVLCVLWLYCLYLGNSWVRHYLEKAKNLSRGSVPEIKSHRNVWADDTRIGCGLTLRQTFYLLPLAFIFYLTTLL